MTYFETAKSCDIEEQNIEERVEELAARQEITDVLCRYARGVDRRDWELVRTCFYADATDSHGEFSGSPEEFIEWVSKRHAAIPFSMHFLGNCLIDFQTKRSASVETYFIAFQRRPLSDAKTNCEALGTDYEVFGRYWDHFEKRTGSWRIARRSVVYDSTSTASSTAHLRALVGVIGTRDRTDVSYEPHTASKI